MFAQLVDDSTGLRVRKHQHTCSGDDGRRQHTIEIPMENITYTAYDAGLADVARSPVLRPF